MREVVKKEVLKLLYVGIIYLVPHSEWVSLVQVVPKKGGMTVVKNEKNELIPKEPSLVGGCALINKNLTRQQRKITFRCPLLMKYWSDWQTALSFVFLMGIQVIIRFRSIQMTKAKPPLHVHMELMLIIECLLDYVMLQLLFKDA
jgi:hypothetical protein